MLLSATRDPALRLIWTHFVQPRTAAPAPKDLSGRRRRPLDGEAGELLLIEGDAEARRVAQHDPAVLDGVVHQAHALLTARADHLHHHVVRQRGRQVRHDVRRTVHHRHRQLEAVGQIGHLHGAGDARRAHADLNDVHGFVGDQRDEIADLVQVLAGGDGRPDPLRHPAQPPVVPAPRRLLGPGDVEVLLEKADVADGLLGRPILVGVDHQYWLLAGQLESVVHDLKPPQIHLPVEAHLQFAGLDPLRAIPS